MAHRIVGTVMALGLVWQSSLPARQQTASTITDPEAYAVYAAALQNVVKTWNIRTQSGPLIFLQETTSVAPHHRQCVRQWIDDPVWGAAGAHFERENQAPRLLTSALPPPGGLPYRFMSRADLDADDARLQVKYPGVWQRRPESLDYLTVSAVGFDAARTRALVYIEKRGRGEMRALERQGTQWTLSVAASNLGRCSWIA